MPPSDPETVRWFAEQVQPHESDLRAYLRSRFPAEVDFDDLVQETYARILQAREQARPRCTRAYLFATARNAVFDWFRRKKILSIESTGEIESLRVPGDRLDVAEMICRNQEFELLSEAIASLPERCRQIVTLRKLHGASHREIARQLGIAENTVNAQIAIGVLRLRDYLKARGVKRGGT